MNRNYIYIEDLTGSSNVEDNSELIKSEMSYLSENFDILLSIPYPEVLNLVLEGEDIEEGSVKDLICNIVHILLSIGVRDFRVSYNSGLEETYGIA